MKQKRVKTLVLAASICLLPVVTHAAYDICGCAGSPESLGVFDTTDPSTWPPGTTTVGTYNETMTIPLPSDGVLIFDSVLIARRYTSLDIRFTPNNNNTPVTILVAGDFKMGYRTNINVSGANGGNGSTSVAGHGGTPGPGGFRGADGAYMDGNLAVNGGKGLGPTGGDGGIGETSILPTRGTFPGTISLRPMLGGSGGGGGYSSATGNCSGGGGGGGGGAILIAANGTINLDNNYYSSGINADGGQGGNRTDSACSSAGAYGSGGAIRLIAQKITGRTALWARGGRQNNSNNDGIIRIESPNDSLAIGQFDPVPIRTGAISPLVNPLASWVEITTVDGTVVPTSLQGPSGGIDVFLDAPGSITMELNSGGVPAGTTINVTVKPKVGGTPIVSTAIINASNCDSVGNCSSYVTVDLAPGAYYAEAEATFQVP